MLINKVKLASNSFAKTKAFYLNRLGATLLRETPDSFSIKIGASELSFTETNSGSKPFYHLAFNIPSNQFQEAKRWIKALTPLNTEDGDDEVYFSHINAHSLYFTDPNGNIVELIARHSISPESNEPFSMDSLLAIGEINVTTGDIDGVGQKLIDVNIPIRDHEALNPDGLTFMGSDGAFLLLGKPGRRWFFSEQYAEIHPLTIEVDFKTEITQDGTGDIHVSPLNEKRTR
ncbi:VOC family protein [Peribacillus sp. NPDC097675]|uniref:VOC family protein n=1 Tax=Peribacillus sp. NPDC097675 TaxID=3390618 RepID=UPI003D009F75